MVDEFDSSSPRFIFEAGVKRPTYKELKEKIKASHRTLLESLSAVKDEVTAAVDKDPDSEVDPYGFRVYGFDASTVSAAEAIDISRPSSNKGPDPDIEVHFYPSTTLEGGQSTPESYIVLNKAGERLDIHFYPFGSLEKGTTEFTQIEIALLSPYSSSLRGQKPVVISEEPRKGGPQEGSVMFQHVRADEADDALLQSSLTISELAEKTNGIKEDRYHLRAFGNRRDSPMRPVFKLVRPPARPSS